MEEKVLKKAWAHAQRHAAVGKEALGLLTGQVFSHQGREYVFVEDYVTAENEASAVHVRFKENAFAALAKKISGNSEKVFVGWSHSHPSFGCFLSSTDLRTHEEYFPEKWHVALVVDPVGKEKKLFKTVDGKAVEASYAVVRRK